MSYIKRADIRMRLSFFVVVVVVVVVVVHAVAATVVVTRGVYNVSILPTQCCNVCFFTPLTIFAHCILIQ